MACDGKNNGTGSLKIIAYCLLKGSSFVVHTISNPTPYWHGSGLGPERWNHLLSELGKGFDKFLKALSRKIQDEIVQT